MIYGFLIRKLKYYIIFIITFNEKNDVQLHVVFLFYFLKSGPKFWQAR